MPDETKEQLKGKTERLEKEVKELKEDCGDADKYATIGSRVAAAVIDVILIFVLGLITALIGGVIFVVENAMSLFLVLLPSLHFVYFIILEGGIGKGQTIGKRLLHIKVIRENGESPSYFQSFIRTFTRFLDLCFIFHVIGLLAAALTGKRQRVGDLLAKTLVVKEDVTTPPKSKAEKKSTISVILLVAFVIFMLVIVVLIVGIVLWQLGVFNMDGTAKSFTGFEAVKPLSWAVATDGSATITMVNVEGAAIILTNCSMSMYGSECGTCMLPENSEVKAGSESQITIGPSYDCEGGPGEPYRAEISISYDKHIGTIIEAHTSTGAISGPYE